MPRAFRLIKVEPGENNNKFYNLTEQADGSWEAHWGRVGNTGEKQIYDAKTGPKKHTQKLKRGYVDQTHLFAEPSTQKDEGFKIENKEVKAFVELLQKYANISVSSNYVVTSEQVTQKQVDEAQTIVDEISKFMKLNSDVKALNEHLVNLYKVIPRKMKKVQDHLIKKIKDDEDLKEAQRKLQEEQDLLDVMAGQVVLTGQQKKSNHKGLTLVDVGLVVEPVTADDIRVIKDKMGRDHVRFRKGFRVTNIKTQAAYDKCIKDAKDKYSELLWHGSVNENWWSISTTGLRIRPSQVANGSAFGIGIYAANKAQKSIGYTSISGAHWTQGSSDQAFLALYDFHLGKQYIIYAGDSSLNRKKLQDKGNFDSTYAKANDGSRGGWLRNDEFIIYQDQQCTIKYLIEIN